jgi:hypothetical protein
MTILRLFVAATAFVYASAQPALTIEATFGNCSPILNINFADARQAESFFGPQPSPEDRAERLSTLVQCDEYITDQHKRLEILIFSISQTVLMKEEYLLPAINAFIDEPSQVKAAKILFLSNITSIRIQAVLERLTALQAQDIVNSVQRLQTITRGDLSLDGLFRNLNEKIDQRLELDSALNHLTLLSARDVLIPIRENLVRLIGDLKSVRNQLGSALGQQ